MVLSAGSAGFGLQRQYRTKSYSGAPEEIRTPDP